jgi:hypothetical protein
MVSHGQMVHLMRLGNCIHLNQMMVSGVNEGCWSYGITGQSNFRDRTQVQTCSKLRVTLN